MRVGRRDFLIAVTLSAAAAMPAWGQDAASAVGPALSATQGAASIPELSGTWVYPFCCGFAPPLSGPGPVLNKSRMPRLFGPDGLRLPAGANAPLVSNLCAFVGDYTNPILKPAAAEVVKKHGEIELSGVPYPTPRNQCWPEGVPFVFANFGMTMLQQPDKITILYEHDHQVRHVRMNQSHPVQVTPSWYGDSIGHYDGDMLVMDTVGIKIGPFSMVDWYGTPYTKALHVVEHYRLIEYEAVKEAEEWAAKEYGPIRASGASKGLQLQFTVEDEGVFTMPWSATITYRRSFREWPEFVCAENLRAIYATKDSAVPRADKPDF
jgi:hypothetical protein